MGTPPHLEIQLQEGRHPYLSSDSSSGLLTLLNLRSDGLPGQCRCGHLHTLPHLPVRDGLVGVAAEVGHLPLGGQVEKGPFFTGDSSNKKKLAPLDTSAGVRGVLDQHADRTFNRPSVQIDAQGIKWNYGDLKAHVDATATGLLELGVEKGDTIALWANSPAEKLLTELSAAVLGASLVEAKSASALSGAKVIVFDGSDSAAAAAVGAASGVKLQTAGAPVAGAYPFQDIPVYGPLFPDPLDALPASASDILDNKYKQLGAGDLLTL